MVPRRPAPSAVLTAATLLAFLPGAPAAAGAARDDAEAAIQQLLAQEVARGAAPGLGAAVLRGGEMLFAGGAGFADLENEVAVDAETVFRIGSVTKQFTAAAIMRLVENGDLGLDDEVAPHVPEFDFQGRAVTVRHLLTHTSGIPSYTDLDDVWMPRLHEELSALEILEIVDGQPYAFEPGSAFHYNNSGYVMLGLLIERVSGQPWDRFVADELLDGLGVGSIRFGSESALIPHRAEGYTRAGAAFENDRAFSMSHPAAAGALVANPADLVRWSRALATGEVVAEESYEMMCTAASLAGGRPAGYGFGLMPSALEDVRLIGHGGGIFGFTSFLAAFPDEDVHVAVIANSDGFDCDRLARQIARVVLERPNPAPQDLAVTEAEIAHCSGRYRGLLATAIRGRDERLYLEGEGQQEVQLLHQGGLLFRAAFDPELRIRFDAEGQRAAGFVLTQGGADLRFERTGD